jgi:O-antigen/teichoic acid export membrane protein
MTVEKQVLAALKWTSLAKLVGQIISWGVTLIVLRLLLPADYGLMAIVSVIIAVLTSVAELGLGASLVQAPQLARDDLSAVTGVVILLNLGIGVLIAVSAPLAAWLYAEPRLTLLIQIGSLHFVLNALGTIPQAVAFRELNFRWLAWVELAAVMSNGLATLVLAWYGYGVWALLLGSLLQNLVRTALLLRHGMPRPIFQREGLRRHVTFGGTITAVRLITQIVYQSDIFIAGLLLSQQALGLYSVSAHLATLPMQKIMSVINQVAFPAVARLQHDRERLRLRMIESTRLLVVFSLPALWGMSAVAPEFVASIMGPNWAGAVFPLQAVCLVVPMRMLNMIYTTAALGVGDLRVNVGNAMTSAIVLPLSFYIGGHWGVDGLALAWVVAIPFVFLFRLPRMLRIVDIRLTDMVASLRAPVLAGAIMYAAVSLGRLPCETLTPVARLAPLIILGAAAYVGTVLLLDRRIVPDVLRVVRGMRA